MTEIGSEFWDVPAGSTPSELFSDKTELFLSGRSALRFIIDDIAKRQRIRSAALPSWCCDSMILPFLQVGIEVKFYDVLPKADGGLVQSFYEAEDCDILLVMDYFGYDSGSCIKDYDGVVIRDLTHSIFSKSYDDAHYFFGSLRKWSGFYTGGFGWKKNGCFESSVPVEIDREYVALRMSAMEKKREYILGKTRDKGYLETFELAEERLEQCRVLAAADEDVERMRLFDAEFVKTRRQENAKYLLEHFSNIAIFPFFEENDCPLFVPIAVPHGKRDELKRYLIENEIYCPVHWPLTKYHHISGSAEKIYENELSLVCDQRYGANDMERMAETIKNFWRE